LTVTNYRVTDFDGNVVERGDTVADFRGDTVTFEYVSRGPEYNGTAKVVVQECGHPAEYYARVFGLTVTPID
jgi:hypothetical protein